MKCTWRSRGRSRENVVEKSHTGLELDDHRNGLLGLLLNPTHLAWFFDPGASRLVRFLSVWIVLFPPLGASTVSISPPPPSLPLSLSLSLSLPSRRGFFEDASQIGGGDAEESAIRGFTRWSWLLRPIPPCARGQRPWNEPSFSFLRLAHSLSVVMIIVVRQNTQS